MPLCVCAGARADCEYGCRKWVALAEGLEQITATRRGITLHQGHIVAEHPLRAVGWRSIFIAFVVIAALLACTGTTLSITTRRSQKEGEALMRNGLASIELVDRMGIDVSRRWRLAGELIAEAEPQAMVRLERQMARVAADYQAASSDYERLVTFPGEAEAWHKLTADVAELEGPLASVLALARQGRAVDARAALRALEGGFAAIDRDTAVLVAINRKGADAAAARARQLRRWSSSLMAATMLGQVALTLVVGVWTANLVRERDKEVRRHGQALEQRNQELDAFAGRVAHDLAAPLATISLAAASLGIRHPEEEKAAGLLQRGVGRMRTLIDDLLALSRLGTTVCDKGCDPAVIAAWTSDELGERLMSEGVTVSLDVRPARVHCPEGLLRQVLVNLLDNSTKYRRPDVPARIEVLGFVEKDRYRLEVKDNGIGMSVHDARHAFEPFYRADGGRGRQGTGLGLSIVKRVVEVSGGTIAIDAQLGRGTKVRIDLPLA